MGKLWLILTVVTAFSLALAGAPAFAADDHKMAIKARKDLMKSNNKFRKAMEKAAKEGDLAALAKDAEGLAANMAKIANPCAFPKGSTAEDSRAKKAIWENWDKFAANAKAGEDMAKAIAKNAKEGNKEAAVASTESYNKQVCVHCHREFRGPKKKKS